ncbi:MULTISPECIES: peptide deformylase [Deinococcus]|uniref:Peptide deformylase n=1 Tax=Deinococcus radiodurans (strain ATCC 13939 / DSM 20539 / JCM 16871 / CCUG 27074 / LMG 4051 / NBRC 15346 / NCIMB 9279 / VKM B-1422 / R1) TaxID=243230 RepID=DEF_DEIRA|nr:peptide deformylase [Deinococcus radiodurans]Q9RRQ4.1 RecName: Full=Peptide deformylase; Short=PDF; AltName: Full=Polypeptide deformylase [Deinococcus radiodurans R1 = ATCC 13939 = DSM 20539]AAF11975.1 polypeptide deformylase [Deinococcus radiodurans R1 = ATCC 13939 = DSM 20539]QEM71806.1 peptide deformylase [Deinococcus radiodurans]QIP28089.1 peptide deformylase [Deinococcus radiodurans]QIP31031.1 peptide deformylase [Deinococcus radiodurans]UDL01447.1 peptide deformylase [Deinococcus rad
MTAPDSSSAPAPLAFGGKPRVYPMRLYGDPILRRKARNLTAADTLHVPGFEPQTVREVADTMLETMFEERGVGLAAPQIGLPVRMFVAVEYADDEEENEGQETPLRSRVLREYVMLNPVVKVINKKKDKSYQEGCLSIPGIYEDGVPRARQVRVDYTDLDGQPRSIEAEDYLARVFQHETDHLDGKLFLDHLPADITEDHRKDLLRIQQASKNFLAQLSEWDKAQRHLKENL